MGQLGQQVVRADRTGDEADQRARAHPLQAGRLHGRLGPDPQHLVPDLCEEVLLACLVNGFVDGPPLRALLGADRLLVGLLEGGPGRLGGLLQTGLLGLPGRLQNRLAFPLGAFPGQLAQRRARGARQRDGLQHRQAVGDRVRTEHTDRRGHRPLGAHTQAERGHQLGHVHAQQQVAGRDLTAAQLGEDHLAGTIHQNRVTRQPAVRDAPGLQRLHLVPGVAQQLVGDLLVGQRVQRAPAGVLVDEHHRVRPELRGGDQLGGVGARRDRRVREQRLLLQRLAQRLQAGAGGEAPQGQVAPRAVEEALGLLFPVDDRDVQRRAVLQGDEIASAAVAVLGLHGLLAGRADGMESDVPEARHQGLPGGADVGRADRVQRAVGDGPADQHRQDDRERGRVAGDQHRERVERQHDPQHRAPPGSAGHADGRHVGDDGCQVAVHRVGQGVDVPR